MTFTGRPATAATATVREVRDAWGSTIRDGFGQTEMTCCIGNSPGQPVKDGSMGRPLPGYPVAASADPAATARSVYVHARERLAAYQRVRILEFVEELPKTISGKIRRVELRERERERLAAGDTAGQHLEREYR